MCVCAAVWGCRPDLRGGVERPPPPPGKMSGRPNPRQKRLVRTRRLSGSDSEGGADTQQCASAPPSPATAWRRRIDMSGSSSAAAPSQPPGNSSKWKRVAVRAVQIQGNETVLIEIPPPPFSPCSVCTAS